MSTKDRTVVTETASEPVNESGLERAGQREQLKASVNSQHSILIPNPVHRENEVFLRSLASPSPLLEHGRPLVLFS